MTNYSSALGQAVHTAVQDYFIRLDGQPTNDLYNLVLTEIETALLATVLEKTRGNQSSAAEILGINRGTLRKKLKQYQLDND